MSELNVTLGNTENLDVFTEFKNDRERIKILSARYKNKPIVEAFKEFYSDADITTDLDKSKSRAINKVTTLSVGKIYLGEVKSLDKNGIVFDISGVKEEIRCKENFNDCLDNIKDYLARNNNLLYFEVREKKNGKVTVSVTNAYYRRWMDKIEKVRKGGTDAIKVHIDSLIGGGYMCHCLISELCDLTGKNYTSSVFIPGSQIVLNIEDNFEKWVGEDVLIFPKNFVAYKPTKINGEVFTENSLVGSRKEVLQFIGTQNLYQMWLNYALSQRDGNKWESEIYDGVITGITDTSKKKGAFVELVDQKLTALIPTRDYLKYHRGDKVKVKIKEFEVQDGKKPFEINTKKNNLITKCNVRLVLEVVE